MHGHSRGANSHETVALLEGLQGGCAGLEPARGKIEENLRAAKLPSNFRIERSLPLRRTKGPALRIMIFNSLPLHANQS